MYWSANPTSINLPGYNRVVSRRVLDTLTCRTLYWRLCSREDLLDHFVGIYGRWCGTKDIFLLYRSLSRIAVYMQVGIHDTEYKSMVCAGTRGWRSRSLPGNCGRQSMEMSPDPKEIMCSPAHCWLPVSWTISKWNGVGLEGRPVYPLLHNWTSFTRNRSFHGSRISSQSIGRVSRSPFACPDVTRTWLDLTKIPSPVNDQGAQPESLPISGRFPCTRNMPVHAGTTISEQYQADHN